MSSLPTSSRRSRRSILSALIALMLGAAPAYCADKAAAKEQDRDFQQFYTQFQQAVAKSDKQKVASLTKLPYMFDSKNLDRGQFIAKFETLFPSATRKCLSKAKPIKDQQCYMAFCGEEIFIFARVDGQYKFTEIGVND